MTEQSASFGVVVIGRNEGERLKVCLRSLPTQDYCVVYVDSGSTDGSNEFAASLGVEVVNLDMTKPFSMARGRNAGVQYLLERQPDLEYLQFVDGDCEVVDTWIPAAMKALNENPDVAVVCGRRRERFPEASIYNRLCDIEWNTPVGPAKACGGDAMYRATVFQESGGFNESLIAGEEPELCLRIRRAGHRVLRLDEEMTRHDAHILYFGPWWRRTYRSGYGAMDVYTRLKDSLPPEEIPFHALVSGASRWSIQWLAAILILILITGLLGHAWIGLFLGIGLWAAQALRIAASIRSRSPNWPDALSYGIFTLIGKWAQVLGIRAYKRDVRNGKTIKLIEYK